MKPYYDEDGITIYHGDCREHFADFQLPTPPMFLMTDPPYPNKVGHFESDIAIAREVLAAWGGMNAIVFWNELEQPAMRLPLVALHIWHRANVNGRPYEAVYQFCIDGKKRRSEVFTAAAVFGGVGPGCEQFYGHPTQKNTHVMCWLVQKAPAGAIIFDPFCGSGTTIWAAKQLGFRAIGIEIEERYCEIAAKRLSQGVLDLAPETTKVVDECLSLDISA